MVILLDVGATPLGQPAVELQTDEDANSDVPVDSKIPITSVVRGDVLSVNVKTKLSPLTKHNFADVTELA